jgi:Protein of unknwon function (DUF3310)
MSENYSEVLAHVINSINELLRKLPSDDSRAYVIDFISLDREGRPKFKSAKRTATSFLGSLPVQDSPVAHDPVHHPAHYTTHPSGVECIDVVEHLSFNVGNAVKYLWRAGLKDDRTQDLKKAVWYVEREIKRLSKEKP